MSRGSCRVYLHANRRHHAATHRPERPGDLRHGEGEPVLRPQECAHQTERRGEAHRRVRQRGWREARHRHRGRRRGNGLQAEQLPRHRGLQARPARMLRACARSEGRGGRRHQLARRGRPHPRPGYQALHRPRNRQAQRQGRVPPPGRQERRARARPDHRARVRQEPAQVRGRGGGPLQHRRRGPRGHGSLQGGARHRRPRRAGAAQPQHARGRAPDQHGCPALRETSDAVHPLCQGARRAPRRQQDGDRPQVQHRQGPDLRRAAAEGHRGRQGDDLRAAARVPVPRRRRPLQGHPRVPGVRLVRGPGQRGDASQLRAQRGPHPRDDVRRPNGDPEPWEASHRV